MQDQDSDIDVIAALRIILRRWPIVVASVVAAILVAIVYLNLSTYRFAIQMRVSPVATAGGDGLGSKLSQLGGLAAVAGVSVPDSAGSGSFKLYVEALHSRDVAAILARDPTILHGVFHKEWDFGTRKWRAPAGSVHDIATAIKPILGVPQQPWEPPGAARLQTWMSERILIDQNIKNPVVTIALNSEDPAFAIYFLQQLNTVIDELLRQRALLRTDEYIRYLSSRLLTISLAEQRVAIAQALGEQERIKMAASSGRPFAAEVFEHPAASDRPVSPSPVKTLVIAAVLGLVLGLALVLVSRSRERTGLAFVEL